MAQTFISRLMQRIPALLLHPLTALAAILLCTAFLHLLERAVEHMPFVMLAVLGVAAVLFLITRRLYFSLYTALAAATLMSIISVMKYRTKGFDLHIYDLVFTGTDPKAFAFLIDGFAAYIVPVTGLLICGIIALSLVFTWDEKRNLSLVWRGLLVAAVFALIPVSYPLKADEPRYFHYLGGFNASAFFVSFLDLRDAAIGKGIADRFAGMPDATPFAAPGPCDADRPKPDIFVVLSESQTDLGQLHQHGLNEQFADHFRSADGKRRELRVETFGGGTWISNFSLMTGLSSLDFGWRAPYLTTTMEGKVHASLATELSRCGYRTAVLMPMDHGFVNEGPFLESIGFDEVLDYDRIGATEYAHPDRFYFEAARAFVEDHRRTDGRPLFLQVQTMFAHSPYGNHLAESEPDAFARSGNSELDEYVRRVAQSQRDFDWYLAQAEAESVDHPSVVMEFGDHQSFATRELINHLYPDFAVDTLTSSAYRSYFTIHPMGAEIDMKPFELASLDIGYLGVSLLESVGLATSPMFADLAALRDRCNGRLHFCVDRAAVDLHLQRRIASGHLTVD